MYYVIYVVLLALGIFGAFNCQGACWCRVGKNNLVHDKQPGTVTGVIQARDVDYLAKVAYQSWNGDVIVYSHIGVKVVYLRKNASLHVTLRSLEYEVFTVVPVKHLNGASFASLGLISMFNSGGTVRELRYAENAGVELRVQVSGTIGVYSSAKPKSVAVESKLVDFSYNDACDLVTF